MHHVALSWQKPGPQQHMGLISYWLHAVSKTVCVNAALRCTAQRSTAFMAGPQTGIYCRLNGAQPATTNPDEQRKHANEEQSKRTCSFKGAVQLEQQQLPQCGHQLPGGHQHIDHISILINFHPLACSSQAPIRTTVVSIHSEPTTEDQQQSLRFGMQCSRTNYGLLLIKSDQTRPCGICQISCNRSSARPG